MTSQNDAPAHPRRGWADKRQAIIRGARTVFGRDGYAGIDAIATEAGVSTRTIYNHFQDKEQLFSCAIQESAVQVRDALVEQMSRHLDTVTDLEADLLALAHAWVASMAQFPDHFALVRLMTAEANRFPAEALDAWQELGPRAARAALAHHLGLLAGRGLLEIGDPDRAARHFHLLVFAEVTERSHHGAVPLDEAVITEIITAGVRTFLRGHIPPPGAGRQQ
ncbi:TetR/AcrR family transcriptional regulator [Candidatus Frankia alpina]|uniref:TetR/AcrR family transcriptional regulator n=1 Tax=Candidatus Frankia alpina TaxID=2699483 RepID=A0A4S5EJ12_9ACTN|nr:TetR/AcrR family transcriptional regulator [Candidatus Frankia alpina]THJ71872.1 TetR/AcrR family transcriptional regulator [Candidatus Frankia alpina]